MQTATAILTTLAHCTGSETWYRHGLNRRITYTEGCHYLAEAAGASWLLDTIALAQMTQGTVKAEPFQVWTLTRTEDTQAVLICEDGNDHPLYQEQIVFTDFPLDTITLWCVDNVILLPSEY